MFCQRAAFTTLAIDVGDKVKDTEHHLEARYLGEQERPEETHRYGDRKEDGRPDQVVPKGRPEIPVGDDVPVVLQADKLGGPDPRPLGERVVDGGDGRPEYDKHVDDEEREHEEPGGQEPPPPEAAPGTRRFPPCAASTVVRFTSTRPPQA